MNHDEVFTDAREEFDAEECLEQAEKAAFEAMVEAAREWVLEPQIDEVNIIDHDSDVEPF